MIDTARVESPVTHENAQQAFDFLMDLKVVGQLLQRMDESSTPIEIHRWKDLGGLICRLSEQPASVLGEVVSEKSD